MSHVTSGMVLHFDTLKSGLRGANNDENRMLRQS